VPVESRWTADPGSAGRPAFGHDPAITATVDRLIAELAAAEADRGRESRLGQLQGRFGTRGGAVTLAVIGGVALLAVAIVGLTVLGLLV
jgi:hypothetical protein